MQVMRDMPHLLGQRGGVPLDCAQRDHRALLSAAVPSSLRLRMLMAIDNAAMRWLSAHIILEIARDAWTRFGLLRRD